MHVGAIAILEREPFYGPDGRFRLGDVRDVVESRLSLIPRFRRRVEHVPFGLARPIWVDDPTFDIARHVKLTRLPTPGSRRQLISLAERLMEQILDRDHPLWELWFVEGVDRGDHVGLVHKSHHTLTDGISGIDIATALFDFSRDPTVHRRTRMATGAGARPGATGDRQHLRTDPSTRGARRSRATRRGGARRRRRPCLPTRAVDRLARRHRPDRAHALDQRSHRARSPDRKRARSARAGEDGEQGLRLHRQRRRARGRRRRARSAPRRARRAPPRPVSEDLLPGVGARRKRAHAAREPDLGDVRAARRRRTRREAASSGGAHRHGRAEGARTGGGRGGADRPDRVRGTDIARARGPRRARPASSPTSSSPTSRARRSRSTASARRWWRCTHSRHSRGTSRSTSR